MCQIIVVVLCLVIEIYVHFITKAIQEHSGILTFRSFDANSFLGQLCDMLGCIEF